MCVLISLIGVSDLILVHEMATLGIECEFLLTFISSAVLESFISKSKDECHIAHEMGYFLNCINGISSMN